MSVESILSQINEHKLELPHRVICQIQVGDFFYRNLHPSLFMYSIDSLETDLAICSRDSSETDFLHRVCALRPYDSEAWRTLFSHTRRNGDGKMICPFSWAIARGYGESFEKSLLFHLREQGNGQEVYTVWGFLHYLEENGSEIRHAHAWNITTRLDALYLVDMHHPVNTRYRKDDRMCARGIRRDKIPFAQQISEIKEGKFILPHFRRWSYHLEFLRREED